MADGYVPLSRIACCTLRDVKDLVDPQLSGTWDGLMVHLINGFSKFIEGERILNRSLEKTTYTEIYDGELQCRIVVKAPPIVNDDTLTIWNDYDREFTSDSTKLIKFGHYKVNWDNGTITLLDDAVFEEYPQSIKIVYNGGLVLNDEQAEQIDVPDDLRLACAMQVAFWFQRRNELGIQSVASFGGDATYFTPTKLLPSVQEILGAYRHHRL